MAYSGIGALSKVFNMCVVVSINLKVMTVANTTNQPARRPVKTYVQSEVSQSLQRILVVFITLHLRKDISQDIFGAA